jgi:hypothetical protein
LATAQMDFASDGLVILIGSWLSKNGGSGR